MSTNEVFTPDKARSMPVPAGTKSGDPVRIGIINGVAVTDRAAVTGLSPFNTDGTVNTAYSRGGGNPDGNASVWTWGAHRFNVKATGKPAFGAAVYFDPAATPKLTVTAGSLSVFGAIADNAPTDNGDGSWSCLVDIASPVK